MKTRIVYPQLWLDEKFATCSQATKLLFCYLINNLQLGLSRYTHISDRQIMFDTGLNSNQLETGKKELSNLKWCFFVPNWVYHNHSCAYVDYDGRDRVLESKEEEIAKVPTKVKEVFKGLITGYEPVLNHKSEIINKKSFGKYENLFFGDVPEDLMDLACSLEPRGDARTWQEYAAEKIRELGYLVDFEVGIDLDGDRNGRIDLIANKNGKSFAIELDYRTPRKKSIEKVKKFGAGMVLLRDPKITNYPEETKFKSLKSLTPTVLQELATEKRISLKDCQTTYTQMKDWLESKGKTYKDYKAGLRNWINKKLEEGRIKHITPEVKREPTPIITEEERAKNIERLAKLRSQYKL
ncbi:MAG: hypothetical protein ACOX6V_05495 [Patescibacteria group bacterium]|jgi:hypothetical protein